jgi:hypothetical protein
MAIPVTCWRCEEPGHVAAECKREPAKTRQQLSQRIRRYVELWNEGLITTAQKAKWIAGEMKAFKPPKKARAK